MAIDIETLTVEKARAALDAGEYTAVDLTKRYLEEIKKRNDELNVYIEVFDDCLEQAAHADQLLREKQAGPLTGIPVAVKDNMLIEGKMVSAGSRILEKYVATYDATVIKKLKEQGVVFLGRTNMDEFAMGSSTEHSAFGVTKNPHDTTRVPGGSSGGSAAAVASNLALAAFGSDTGGSIRQPAAFSGVVGLKPTYGLVSRSGLIAMGSSLDQIGPFTRTTKDAQIVFGAIKGHDPKDSTSLPDDFCETKNKKRVIGVPRDFFKEGVDADVLESFEASLEKLKDAGYDIVDIKLPHAALSLATYYIIMPAESSTNLARFDGIRYGLSVDGADLQAVYTKTRGEGFGSEVRRRILLGTFVLSSGYADAYYRQATAVRELIRKDLSDALEKVAAIATPTTPTPAFKIGEKEDPLAMYAADVFTVPANLAGNPALSIPGGTVERDGTELPIGFQLIGAHGDESTLFTIASDLEGAQ